MRKKQKEKERRSHCRIVVIRRKGADTISQQLAV